MSIKLWLKWKALNKAYNCLSLHVVFGISEHFNDKHGSRNSTKSEANAGYNDRIVRHIARIVGDAFAAENTYTNELENGRD